MRIIREKGFELGMDNEDIFKYEREFATCESVPPSQIYINDVSNNCERDSDDKSGG